MLDENGHAALTVTDLTKNAAHQALRSPGPDDWKSLGDCARQLLGVDHEITNSSLSEDCKNAVFSVSF